MVFIPKIEHILLLSHDPEHHWANLHTEQTVQMTR